MKLRKVKMKKLIVLMLGLSAVANVCVAKNSNKFIKANIELKNAHSVVSSGTWFSMDLTTDLVASTGTQKFSATLVDPIYNQNFSEGLIPAKAVVNGTYHNDGSTCSFEIDSISFKGTEIGLAAGAYSIVNATVADQPECNPRFNYGQGQHMEFQTKVDIPDLIPINRIKDYTVVKNDTDDFVQAYGNSDYAITGITKFTNGLMQVNVRFYDSSIREKLVPVYFDEAGLAHCLNFTIIATDLQTGVNDTSSYLVLAHYNNFGFGILDK